ncbi:Mucin-like protein [Lamellibrachia satsuma]|nr:Mucin-like protein [Lamellibrachia satsuma]
MPGYTGDRCETDINECASNPCTNGASCVDAVNSYSCSCRAGYTGDGCETDINECASNPCVNGASCSDEVNAFSCACAAGYTGDRCETDIDECASDPCQNGGTCDDYTNGYTCECLDDLYTGTLCETAIFHRHYQYGPHQDDVSLRNVNCDSENRSCSSDFIRVPKVQIFNGQYKRMKIYTNGYVTFGMNFENRYPDTLNKEMLSYAKRQTAEKQGFAMLAPLWTDNDAVSGDYYYHIYDLTKPGTSSTDQARVKHATDHARLDILKNGGVSVTDATWVMVITWSRVLPRMYLSVFDSPNTFQLVIAYDPSRYQTFATYIYKDMGWDDEYKIRRSMIGYLSYKYTDEESLQLAPSMKSTAFRLNTRIGNTGDRGRYMFRVASGSREINYEQKCYNWFANEMRRWLLVRYLSSWTLPCPCDRRLAMMDGRWTFDLRQFYKTNFERMCFYERIPRMLSAQECCYSNWGSLISTEDGRGGQTFLFHPHWSRQHQKYDVTPKQWCCRFSDNCNLYYFVRPVDHCSGYQPLCLGWFYGDPHIRTLDGFQYTFNGLGEYTLIETTHGNFTLQGRTAKARDANGTETDATVFSAFAAKDVDSDTVHVQMISEQNGLVVFLENDNVSEWFNAANLKDEKEFSNITIIKKNVTQIEVSFKSGFSLTIGVSAGQLDITVGAPDWFKNNTKGLMGVFNDDPNDDLLPPGENAVPLSNSSSEKTIFKKFGELWRIMSIDSLFYYAPGESYWTFARTEFQPLFLEDVYGNMTTAQRTKAEHTCGDNKECLFDFAVTGKEDAAAATLATNKKNVESAATLSNGSPNITVDKVFNVTAGQTNILKVNTSDPDGDVVIVKLDSSTPDGASFTDGVYTWKPVSMDPMNISYD